MKSTRVTVLQPVSAPVVGRKEMAPSGWTDRTVVNCLSVGGASCF